MTSLRWKHTLILLSLAMALLLVVAACGGDDEEATTSEPATTTTAPAAADTSGDAMAEKPTLVFSDLDWPSAQLQNAIARRILEDGYGYETEAVFGGTVPMLEALRRGDTNVTMEIWLPNQQEAFDEAISAGTIQVIGNSLEDNWQSAFVIPNYTAEAYPNLRSVEDLKTPEHMELFVTPNSKGKAQLINCIPGWECEGVNETKIVTYGLTDYVELVNPGSDSALSAEIRSNFEQKNDVLFHYWGPTVLAHDLQNKLGGYTILEEPPYTEECWAGDQGCAYPTAEILIVIRTELNQQQDLVDLLTAWDFNSGNQLAAEGYMNDSGSNFAESADWFLLNTEEWKTWVTPEALAKIEAALAG